MNIRVPAPLSAEHHELQSELERATQAGGMTAVAAREVARLLHDHLAKEEEFALPPLALLKQLAKGADESSMAEARALTQRLETEMPNLLAEHFAIVQALNRLADAADSEGLPEQIRFADKLIAHVRMEEDILYPAAILVGRHLREAT
ncbi:MAG: hypothetical protein ACK4MV_21100 [Beijerinckiaceae bacterium]